MTLLIDAGPVVALADPEEPQREGILAMLRDEALPGCDTTRRRGLHDPADRWVIGSHSLTPTNAHSTPERDVTAWPDRGLLGSGVPKTAEHLDLDEIRQALEERRDDTRGRVALLAQRPELGSAQGFGKRIGDGTTEAISRLTEIGVGQSLESTLARIERALSKLDVGTYGDCDVCGKPIAHARLQAMPDSVMCLNCAAAERSHRPARR